MEKMIVEENLEEVNFCKDVLLADLIALGAKYPDHTNLRFVCEHGYYEDDGVRYLCGDRLETDVEFEKRQVAAEKRKERLRLKREQKEAEERAIFEKLKAKYG